MRYISLIFAALIFMACSLVSKSEVTVPAITPTSVPTAVNEILSIEPIVATTEDGTIVLQSGSNVTVRWDGLPPGTTVTFFLNNYLVDGGVVEYEEGLQFTFTVPQELEGEILATATLPDETIVEAIALQIVDNDGLVVVGDDCRYTPPALGPGVSLYSEADMNSAIVGDVLLNGEYVVVGVAQGIDDKGGTRQFYQIQQVDTNVIGWVLVNVGERLTGDCSAFQ